MAITISSKQYSVWGNKSVTIADISFDSSYAFGGEPFDPENLFGLHLLEGIHIQPVRGYSFEYDATNKKIKVITPAPSIIFEEPVTVTDDVGTLKYPAAYIMYVGSGDAAFQVIPGGLDPVTGTVSVSEPAWGTRNTLTFLTADAVTSCYVTYITQAWKEIFDNYVLAILTAGVRVAGHADLTFTAGTPDTLDLGEYAVAVQSVMWNDNGTYKGCKPVVVGTDPATTEVTLDFTNATSSETRLSFREEDTVDASTDTVYVQYIKDPGSGFLHERFVEEDDLTPSSDVVTMSSGLVVGSNPLLYCSMGGVPGATAKYALMARSGATIGATATLIQPTTVNVSPNTFTLGSDHADSDHIKPSYLAGFPWEIPGLVPIEVPDAENLSHLANIKVLLIGL